VFFHAQAADTANAGGQLWLGHASFDGTPGTGRRVARMVCETLTSHGFTIEWNGSPDRKIAVAAPDGAWRLDYDRTADEDEGAYA
jgi:hypothetical protein